MEEVKANFSYRVGLKKFRTLVTVVSLNLVTVASKIWTLFGVGSVVVISYAAREGVWIVFQSAPIFLAQKVNVERRNRNSVFSLMKQETELSVFFKKRKKMGQNIPV